MGLFGLVFRLSLFGVGEFVVALLGVGEALVVLVGEFGGLGLPAVMFFCLEDSQVGHFGLEEELVDVRDEK